MSGPADAEVWADRSSADHDGHLLHGSCVAYGGRALLIVGASGAGKSELALSLMAFGAELVADDMTWLHRATTALLASAPETIAGQIEARGLGVLRAVAAPPTEVSWAVHLCETPPPRLGTRSEVTLLGRALPFWKVQPHAALAAQLVQLMKSPFDDPR